MVPSFPSNHAGEQIHVDAGRRRRLRGAIGIDRQFDPWRTPLDPASRSAAWRATDRKRNVRIQSRLDGHTAGDHDTIAPIRRRWPATRWFQFAQNEDAAGAECPVS
jgi:hypothetical protein